MAAPHRKTRHGAPDAVFSPAEIRLIGAAIIAAIVASVAASIVAGGADAQGVASDAPTARSSVG
jgi:hypothetical protein